LAGQKSIIIASAAIPLSQLPALPTGTGTVYIAKVPKRVATSQEQLSKKVRLIMYLALGQVNLLSTSQNAIWPVGFNPHLVAEDYIWSLEEIAWLKSGVDAAVEAAMEAKNAGEV
jgi:hypothetical protein